MMEYPQSRRLRFAGDSMDSGWGHQHPDEADYQDRTWERCKDENPKVVSSGSAGNAHGTGVDLSNHCTPVRDQGLLDACVGFSVAALVEFLQKKENPNAEVEISPRFIWYLARLYDLNHSQNTGAQLRNGMRAIARVGCSPERLDPYDPEAFLPAFTREQTSGVQTLLNEASARRPTPEAIAAASEYRVRGYYRLNTLQEYKECLDAGYGFVMACPIFRSVLRYAAEDQKCGRFRMPWSSERQPDALHSMFVVGYQDCQNDPDYPGGGYLICKGSQGVDRGDEGYFRVPYEYVNRWPGDTWTAVKLRDEPRRASH